MKKIVVILTLLSLMAVSIKSCKPDPELVEKDILIDWIWESMNEVYLWTDDLDQNLYPTDDEPEDFFYNILAPQDIYSWIVDDYKELADNFNNIELSNGISPYFVKISQSGKVVIVVEYVVEGSPADEAGIKRGDIISDINEIEITINNFSSLFYSEVSTLKFADFIDGTVVPNGIEITLTAEVLDSDPVVHYEIINWEGMDIGYLVYTHFTTGEGDIWLNSLDQIFAEFQSSGIDELIIDLRYNPGGSIFMATHIASVLCPASILAGNNILVNLQWNELLQSYFTSQQGSSSENLVILFEESPSLNLDLTSIYFLTGSHTASAPELMMIGLDPYMDVVLVGDSTYGKCYGSISIEDFETPRQHEWAMQPIVIKYVNSEGYTDFLDGIPPDHFVYDDIFDAKAFGDHGDPLLAKGLELISGVSPILKKSTSLEIVYEVLPDPVRARKSRLIHQGFLPRRQ